MTTRKCVPEDNKWTFERDLWFLERMQEISKNLECRVSKSINDLHQLNLSVGRANIALHNATNRLSSLQCKQFLENRVVEDNDVGSKSISVPNDNEAGNIQKNNNQELLELCLKNTIEAWDQCYEKYSIQHDDSDDSDDTFPNYIYHAKNPYNERRLPHIFQSNEWREHWQVGLKDEECNSSGDDISENFSESISDEDSNKIKNKGSLENPNSDSQHLSSLTESQLSLSQPITRHQSNDSTTTSTTDNANLIAGKESIRPNIETVQKTILLIPEQEQHMGDIGNSLQKTDSKDISTDEVLSAFDTTKSKDELYHKEECVEPNYAITNTKPRKLLNLFDGDDDLDSFMVDLGNSSKVGAEATINTNIIPNKSSQPFGLDVLPNEKSDNKGFDELDKHSTKSVDFSKTDLPEHETSEPSKNSSRHRFLFDDDDEDNFFNMFSTRKPTPDLNVESKLPTSIEPNKHASFDSKLIKEGASKLERQFKDNKSGSDLFDEEPSFDSTLITKEASIQKPNLTLKDNTSFRDPFADELFVDPKPSSKNQLLESENQKTCTDNPSFVDEPPEDDYYSEDINNASLASAKTTSDGEQEYNEFIFPNSYATEQPSAITTSSSNNYNSLCLLSESPPPTDECFLNNNLDIPDDNNWLESNKSKSLYNYASESVLFDELEDEISSNRLSPPKQDVFSPQKKQNIENINTTSAIDINTIKEKLNITFGKISNANMQSGILKDTPQKMSFPNASTNDEFQGKLEHICKSRARGPPKRKPSTRRARHENYQKNILEDQEDETFNTTLHISSSNPLEHLQTPKVLEQVEKTTLITAKSFEENVGVKNQLVVEQSSTLHIERAIHKSPYEYEKENNEKKLDSKNTARTNASIFDSDEEDIDNLFLTLNRNKKK